MLIYLTPSLSVYHQNKEEFSSDPEWSSAQTRQALISLLPIGLILGLSIHNLSVVRKILYRQTYPNVFNISVALSLTVSGHYSIH